MFLLWGAWVLGSTMVEMAVSVLLGGESSPVGNLAEPPFKRILVLYRPEGVLLRPRRHEINLNGPSQ